MKKFFALFLVLTVLTVLLLGSVACGSGTGYEDKGMVVDLPSDVASALFDTETLTEARELVSDQISDEQIQVLKDDIKNSGCTGIFVVFGSSTSSYYEVMGTEPTLQKNQSCVSAILLSDRENDAGKVYFIVQNNPSTNKSYIIEMGLKLT